MHQTGFREARARNPLCVHVAISGSKNKMLVRKGKKKTEKLVQGGRVEHVSGELSHKHSWQVSEVRKAHGFPRDPESACHVPGPTWKKLVEGQNGTKRAWAFLSAITPSTSTPAVPVPNLSNLELKWSGQPKGAKNPKMRELTLTRREHGGFEGNWMKKKKKSI